MVSMVTGIGTSVAVEGTLGLAGATKAKLSRKGSISLRVSESFKPIRGVRSLSKILN